MKQFIYLNIFPAGVTAGIVLQYIYIAMLLHLQM